MHSASLEMGHADIGGDRVRPGAQLQGRRIGVVPRLPEPVALFAECGPLEIVPIVFAGDLLNRTRLLGNTCLGPVKLKKQVGLRVES